ncbi:MAG: hypothetical protein R2909_00345 [Gemmatimonadales bacterium]
MQAVFTRTVADPDAGLKLTGKVGASANNAIGVFAARDRLTNPIFPSNQRSDAAFLDRDSWTAVGRFRRDLGAASYLGLLYAGRAGAGYLNQTGGPTSTISSARRPGSGPSIWRRSPSTRTRWPRRTSSHWVDSSVAR